MEPSTDTQIKQRIGYALSDRLLDDLNFCKQHPR
jgi:hypothetical protein